MKSTKEFVSLRDDGLPFNIWITDYEHFSHKHHWHEFTEILYVLDGEAIQRINVTAHQVFKGDFIVINGLEMHSVYTEPDKKAKFVVFQLPPSFISLFYRDGKRFRITNDNCIISNTSILHTQISQCMEKIITELINRQSGYEYLLSSYIYYLLGTIYRNDDTEPINEKYYKEQKFLFENLSPVITFIEENFREKITLDDVCSIAGLSPQYFCKSFKKATTHTLIEYINILRVFNAQDLLINSDSSITEIAYSSGFSSTAFFNRVFKKVTGINPSDFRRI